MTERARRHRITANLFGIPFGALPATRGFDESPGCSARDSALLCLLVASVGVPISKASYESKTGGGVVDAELCSYGCSE